MCIKQRVDVLTTAISSLYRAIYLRLFIFYLYGQWWGECRCISFLKTETVQGSEFRVSIYRGQYSCVTWCLMQNSARFCHSKSVKTFEEEDFVLECLEQMGITLECLILKLYYPGAYMLSRQRIREFNNACVTSQYKCTKLYVWLYMYSARAARGMKKGRK